MELAEERTNLPVSFYTEVEAAQAITSQRVCSTLRKINITFVTLLCTLSIQKLLRVKGLFTPRKSERESEFFLQSLLLLKVNIKLASL